MVACVASLAVDVGVVAMVLVLHVDSTSTGGVVGVGRSLNLMWPRPIHARLIPRHTPGGDAGSQAHGKSSLCTDGCRQSNIRDVEIVRCCGILCFYWEACRDDFNVVIGEKEARVCTVRTPFPLSHAEPG